ncbi:unnamed protein product, partial [Brenthis ino]
MHSRVQSMLRAATVERWTATGVLLLLDDERLKILCISEITKTVIECFLVTVNTELEILTSTHGSCETIAALITFFHDFELMEKNNVVVSSELKPYKTQAFSVFSVSFCFIIGHVYESHETCTHRQYNLYCRLCLYVMVFIEGPVLCRSAEVNVGKTIKSQVPSRNIVSLKGKTLFDFQIAEKWAARGAPVEDAHH